MTSKARPPARRRPRPPARTARGPLVPITAADAALGLACHALLNEVAETWKQKRRTSGAEQITVDKRRALKLFTDWHVDEVTERPAARNYARRLWTRLKQEAADA